MHWVHGFAIGSVLGFVFMVVAIYVQLGRYSVSCTNTGDPYSYKSVAPK